MQLRKLRLDQTRGEVGADLDLALPRRRLYRGRTRSATLMRGPTAARVFGTP